MRIPGNRAHARTVAADQDKTFLLFLLEDHPSCWYSNKQGSEQGKRNNFLVAIAVNIY